jgi:predicted alpha/beta superfamily hydrolase
MKEYRIIKVWSEELNKDKRIFLYLPKSYDTSNKFYPVLYMHDGGNLFDDKYAFIGVSWRIMEAYEEYPDLPELIIVGVESDNDRGAELIPYEFTYKDGNKDGGKADDYLGFIAKTLKPFIDRKFRSYQSPKNTGIMGSSFGGVNSIYAALKYSDYFTRFGCLSNALYYEGFEGKLQELAKTSTFENIKKFYMDVGTKETGNKINDVLYINSNKELAGIIETKLDPNRFKLEIVEGAVHNELAWAKRFPNIINFLFNN